MSIKTSRPTRRPRHPVVIVEAGSEGLKLVRTVLSRDGVALSQLRIEPFDTPDEAMAAQALTRAVRELKPDRLPVIGCLPRQLVTIRLLELPSTDPAEIADMVDLQADKQTPYSKDEITWDYRILGAGRQGYTRVMLALVRRSLLRQRYAFLEEAGLDPCRMTVSTEGMLGWIHSIGAQKDGVVVLDVDASCSELAVMGADGLVATRSLLVGAGHLIEDEPRGRRDLCDEVSRSLETCRGEHPGMTLTRLIVTGATAGGSALAGFLGGELGLAAEFIPSTDGVASVPATPSLREGRLRAVSLTSLVGAALQSDVLEFDLVPEAVRLRKELVVNARRMTALGAVVMTALMAASLYGTLKFMLKIHRRDEIRRERVRTDAEAQAVARMQDIVTTVNRRQDTRLSVVRLLEDLHPQVPEAVYLDAVEFDAERQQVSLEGSGASRAEIGTLVQNLEQSPSFERVEAGDSVKGPDNRFKFQIVCHLEARP